MSGSIIKVAAVVVSYNRKALLVECLDALLGQALTLDRIVIVDNKSTDGTVEYLAERGYLENPRIDCVVLDRNAGGAGGFHAGLKRALEQGYDWAWLMDDDAEPDPQAFRLCRRFLDDPENVLVAPAMADAEGRPDFASGMHRCILLPPAEATVTDMGRAVTREEADAAEVVPIDACSFVGPFISLKAVAAVGLPREEFFIHYDDLEYTMRLRQCGRLVLVAAALIKHKQVQLVDRMVVRKTLMGDKTRVRYEKLWPTYYGYRNLTWLIGRGMIPTRLSTLLLWHARLVVGTVLYDDNKWRRLKFWNAALLDGFLGRFDNDKPKKWMPRPRNA